MPTFISRMRCFSRARRGGVVVMTAILLPTMIALAALVVDVGSLQMSKTALENAAISAAEGASERLPDTDAARLLAIKIAQQNLGRVPRIRDASISVTTQASSITVIITGSAATTFGSILDLDRITVSGGWSTIP